MCGVCNAGCSIGEQTLLLRYSSKDEREKNLGMFRASLGMGSLISPLIGSLMYLWKGFSAPFIFVGVGTVFIALLIYKPISNAATEFKKLEKQKDEEECDGLINNHA